MRCGGGTGGVGRSQAFFFMQNSTKLSLYQKCIKSTENSKSEVTASLRDIIEHTPSYEPSGLVFSRGDISVDLVNKVRIIQSFGEKNFLCSYEAVFPKAITVVHRVYTAYGHCRACSSDAFFVLVS